MKALFLIVFICSVLDFGEVFCQEFNPFAAPKSLKKERDYQEDYCPRVLKGVVEYRLEDRTRVDCLTETHAYEFDFGKKWAEAIGQAIFYSAMTEKKAGIVLILKKPSSEKYLKRLNFTISSKKLDIDVLVLKSWEM